jgi:hypothetical protein
MSSDMQKEWYISFHGGVEPSAHNNIHVYSAVGKELRKALNPHDLPRSITFRELRGFTFGTDGDLYVVNAFQDFSQILRFDGRLNKDGQHDFVDVFVQYDAVHNAGLRHPFNALFNSQGDLYATSQDTSLTLRYFGPCSKEGAPGTPMPLPASLRETAGTHFQPGTFCASAKQVPNGLIVVRQALFAAGLLYVADRDADCVKKYDAATGAYRGEIRASGLIDKPIHLAISDGILYIGNRGNESIVKCDMRSETVTTFVPSHAGGLKNPAGLAFGDDGYFYVASRGSRQILRYHLTDGRPDKQPFIDGLSDDPEFIEPVRRS